MNITIHTANGQSPVAVNDRCFNYGDGFFTTIRCRQKCLLHLELHLERLKRAAGVLAFAPIEWETLRQSLLQLANNIVEMDKVVKVLVSRGAGGRGYSPDQLIPQVHITMADYPPIYDNWRVQGIALGISALKLGLSPMLGGIKHCNRLEQVLIKQALKNHPWQDVVVCDLNGFIVECSASNLFWQTGGQWYSPLIDVAGVEGVMKQYLINNMAQLQQTQQVKQPLSALIQADSVFICNSLMGIVMVRSFDNGEQTVNYDVSPGQQLLPALQQMIDETCLA